MNIKEIENLIKFVQKSGVSEVSIEEKEFKITIKTQSNSPREIYHAAPAAAAPVITHTPPTLPLPAVAPVSKASDESKYITIKSPMIGTFYRSATPEKPPFANVGDEVKPGKVICIIEAMKLFNEIECEVSGRIVKVLVDNSTPVEYDQPLFLVEP